MVEMADDPTALPIMSTLNSMLWMVNMLLAGWTSEKHTGAVCQSCVCTISGLHVDKGVYFTHCTFCQASGSGGMMSTGCLCLPSLLHNLHSIGKPLLSNHGALIYFGNE